jgi:putative hydrolase of the HAD superfamily
MKIRTILFDFGNVLAFFDHHQAVRQLAEYSPLSCEEVYRILDRVSHESGYDTGDVETPAFMKRIREECSLDCDDADLARAVSDIFTRNPEICDLLPRLRLKYRLLLLSNTNDLHATWYRRQFADDFLHLDGLIFSHEVRARKPDRKIYEAAHQITNARHEECLFLDDLEPNIDAARAFGWKGIVYRHGNGLAEQLDGFGIEIR